MQHLRRVSDREGFLFRRQSQRDWERHSLPADPPKSVRGPDVLQERGAGSRRGRLQQDLASNGSKQDHEQNHLRHLQERGGWARPRGQLKICQVGHSKPVFCKSCHFGEHL